MDTNSARQRLEDIGLDIDVIEEVLPLVVSEQAPVDDGLSATRIEADRLRYAAAGEEDWRKRASLMARAISIELGG